VGSGVNTFIYRSLEKEREKRFTDASDMLKVFEEVCKNPRSIPEQLMQPQMHIKTLIDQYGGSSD
jgi:hypothetical protein